MRYPQTVGRHVFQHYGTDGDRFARCSCGWESEHVWSKQQVEIQTAEHANANALPLCPACEGSGRNETGNDVCPMCHGTGRNET